MTIYMSSEVEPSVLHLPDLSYVKQSLESRTEYDVFVRVSYYLSRISFWTSLGIDMKAEEHLMKVKYGGSLFAIQSDPREGGVRQKIAERKEWRTVHTLRQKCEYYQINRRQ